MADPNPPKGYTVKYLPMFLRPAGATATIVSAPADGNIIADVEEDKPTTIEVRKPDQFTKPVYTHESTHVYQMSRNPAVVNSMQTRYTDGTTSGGFNYGGIDGLIKAQQQRKTITDFGPEQQARMVEDYQRMTKDALAKGDAVTLDKINQAFHPFIQQLSRLPGKSDSMKVMTKADLTPAAPGLPPAAITGIMQPDKLLGGEGRIIPPKGYKIKQK